MSNESKIHDPRYWKKWRESHAIETLQKAQLRTDLLPIRYESKPITAIGYNHERDISTLHIGNKIINSGDGWSSSESECYCVVPGNNFKIGQMVRAKNLPKDTQTLGQAFPEK